MKKGLVFLTFLLIVLIVVISFNLQPRSSSAITPLNPEYQGIALYLCPTTNSIFTNISKTFMPLLKYRNIGLMFLMLFAFGSLLYALYTSFIKDKFERHLYNTPFGLFIMLFWVFIITQLLIYSPNHFREVWYIGQETPYLNHTTPYVLCDKYDKFSVAVGYKAVSTHKIGKDN